MNEFSATTCESSASCPATQPGIRPVDVEALAHALSEIRDDSQRRPETYLRDTVVPHGGE